MRLNPAGSFGQPAGLPLLTVTETAALIVRLPAASRATAVSVWLPFGAVVVSHVVENGAVVSSAPRSPPSRLNCTPATPTLSDALAETPTGPETVAPGSGAEIATAGAVVSDPAPDARQPMRLFATTTWSKSMWPEKPMGALGE